MFSYFRSKSKQPTFREPEYLDSSGVWRFEPKKNASKAELDSFMADTHLPLERTPQVLSQMPRSNGSSQQNVDWRSSTPNLEKLKKELKLKGIPHQFIINKE